MKKILLNLLTVLIIANVSVAVVSCGDADGEIDYAVLIPGHWFDVDASEDAYVTMSIDYKGAGTIYYNDLVYADWGVSASGTYTLRGNELTAIYTDVIVEDENYEPTTYHGFTDGKSRNVVYVIEFCDGDTLVMKDNDGNTINYEKYKDVG